MESFIALLRGINVSGHKIIKMAALRAMLNHVGYLDVRTYIQSGNIVLRSTIGTADQIAETIKKGIAEAFGFDVPVLVKSLSEFQAIFDKNPYTDPLAIENKRIYFALLKEKPKTELTEEFSKEIFINEEFLLTDACVYLNYLEGAGKAKLSTNLIEKKLKVQATSRNHNTMVKLLEMARKL